ncbi:MAG: flagellin FliC [Deltaproteobacteria bacterium]|nr:flagellin FliC [Deltaproteobacteria bacterium]
MAFGFNGSSFPGFGFQNETRRSYERLSSGRRINSAADDAAALGISENLDALVRSLTVAQRNTGSGINLASVKESALSSVSDITTRMRELAVQAADGSLSATDRGYLDAEFQQLKEEIGRISGGTEYNGQKLLGGAEGEVDVQVGEGSSSDDQVAIKTGGIDTTTLGLDGLSLAGGNGANALAAIDGIDAAAQQVTTARAETGATINRLGIARDNAIARRTSLDASNSAIRDADVAEETSLLARNQVLGQFRISVAAQANFAASLTLNLLNR